MKKGCLVMIGSGIKSVGHITLEAQGWIREADVVLYCVADPATEIWIKQHARKHEDLYALYGNDKPRINTYNEMAEHMLAPLRQGKDVVGVFYGHPGVFVYPTHKAISIAREEGYRAAMLPAISALDCLFADLGVDPSINGCQTMEATDLLLRDRHLNTDGHVVVWQIGCVGDFGFRFSGYDNRNLNVLVEHLERYYDPNHEVVHYQGSQYPFCASCIERMPLRELRNAKVTGISTLYIAPQDARTTDAEMARKLGLRVQPIGKATPQPAQGDGAPQKQTMKARLVPGTPPQPAPPYSQYMVSPPTSGLADFIALAMQSPHVLAEFERDPEKTLNLHARLTSPERAALLSRHPGRIRMAMKVPAHPPEWVDANVVVRQPLPAKEA
jgi:precorrin-6B methylase 1